MEKGSLFSLSGDGVEFIAIGLSARDGVHLVILCPFCADIHLHGAGRPVQYGGRAPHCIGLPSAASYTVVPAPSVEIEAVLRKNLKRMVAKKGVQI